MREPLQQWQNCSSFTACVVAKQDPEHVEVQCDGERIFLETEEGRTVVRGSFGVRAIAPYSITIAPVERRARHAVVPC